MPPRPAALKPGQPGHQRWGRRERGRLTRRTPCRGLPWPAVALGHRAGAGGQRDRQSVLGVTQEEGTGASEQTAETPPGPVCKETWPWCCKHRDHGRVLATGAVHTCAYVCQAVSPGGGLLMEPRWGQSPCPPLHSPCTWTLRHHGAATVTINPSLPRPLRSFSGRTPSSAPTPAPCPGARRGPSNHPVHRGNTSPANIYRL